MDGVKERNFIDILVWKESKEKKGRERKRRRELGGRKLFVIEGYCKLQWFLHFCGKHASLCAQDKRIGGNRFPHLQEPLSSFSCYPKLVIFSAPPPPLHYFTIISLIFFWALNNSFFLFSMFISVFAFTFLSFTPASFGDFNCHHRHPFFVFNKKNILWPLLSFLGLS